MDPFEPQENKFGVYVYAESCNSCHTTFSLADHFLRHPALVGFKAPNKLHWHSPAYLKQSRPSLIESKSHPSDFSDDEIRQVSVDMLRMEASKHAVSLGISCEACHLGSKEHVASGGTKLPKFYPASPHLFVENHNKDMDFGRTHVNVNWACGRCHVGNRPQFAAGMSTWNSVEYSDAMRGGCYTELRCIDCHNPHKRIGSRQSPNWPHSPEFDDNLCLKCHDKYRDSVSRTAHTHHPVGTAGGRCMNCHMPKINEGLQDLVRTHMIYSPTRKDMIEANHPNACNMCHTDRSIDWTLTHLKKWYGARFSDWSIAQNYPDRSASAAVGWAKSKNHAVRLVGADVLIRANNPKELPAILEALDDPYVVNRQFATRGLENLLDVRLSELGYRFYMRPGECKIPLQNIRAKLLSQTTKKSK